MDPKEQEIPQPKTEMQETPESQKKEQKDDLSGIFWNPEIQKKVEEEINKYDDPKVKNNFINYLKKYPENKQTIIESIQQSSEKKYKKTINNIIDTSIEEMQVFKNPEADNKIREFIDINNKVDSAKVEVDSAKVEVEKIDDNLETIDKLFLETEEARDALLKKNDKLNINVDEKAKEEFRASNIGKDLVKKGVSEQQINNYILFKATQKAIESDSSIKESEEGSNFLISLKKLENQLNIRNTNREDFSEDNIGETSKEIFNKDTGNQNLIDTVEAQKEARTSDYKELFNPKDQEKEKTPEEKLHSNYTKFKNFLSSDEQKNYEKIQGKMTRQEKLLPEEETEKKWLNQKLESIQKQFQETTKTSMEQASILGPIMGLANYMDMNIGNSFTWNKSNDITIKNDLLSITGTIDNKPFTLFNNLKDPSKLQTSDYLHQNNEKEFVIGPENRQDTPYIMPGKDNIRATITWEFTENHENILKNSKSLEDYQQTIQKNMCEKTKELYGYKELVQIRMEKQMQKDVAVQEALDMLNTTLFDGQTKDLKDISEDKTLAPLFNHIKDLDYNLENLSGDEIQQLRNENKEIKRILEETKKDQKKSKIGIIDKTLSPDSIENTKNIIEKIEIKEPSLFTFFETIKDPETKMWNIKELWNMLEENKKPEPNPDLYANIEDNRQKENATANMLASPNRELQA